MKRTLSMFLCALVLALGIFSFGVSADTYTVDADGLYTVPLSFEPTSEYIMIVIKGIYDQTNYIEAYNNAPDNDIIYIEQKVSDENGSVTFGPFATNGYYDSTVIIGGNGFDEPYLAGYLSAEGASNADKIDVLNVEKAYTVKGVDSEDVVIEIEAEVYDSFGYPSVTNEKITYELANNLEDVSIEENVITVSNIAKEQVFALTVSSGTATKTVYVEIKREESAASYIEVYENSSFSEAVEVINVIGPEGKYPSVTVYAKTFDQYCEEVEDEYSYVYNNKSADKTFTPVTGSAELKISGTSGVEKTIEVVTTAREDYKSSALELYNLIPECREVLAQDKIISAENGNDVFPGFKWTTQAKVTAFETAINTAQTALDKYGSEGYADKDYSDEVSALKTALSNYNKSFKDGKRIDIEEISIEEQDLRMEIRKSIELTYTTYPALSETTDKIVWSSSDSAVATVDEFGIVKALAGGRVTISAETRSGLKATTEILVVKTATTIELTPREVTATYGEEPVVLTAKISPLDCTDVIVWNVIETGDVLDIIVSEDNKTCTIIPKSAGEARVQVKAEYSKKSAVSAVTVKMPAWETAITPTANCDSGSLLKGTKVSLETATESAKIYYTLDGSIPSKENGRLYRGPIAINQSLTLKAVAVGDNLYNSEIAVYDYEIVSAGVSVDSVTSRPGTQVTVAVNAVDLVNVKEAVICLKYKSPELVLTNVEYKCEYVDEEYSNTAGPGVYTGYQVKQIVLNKEDGFSYDGVVALLTFDIKEDTPEGDYLLEVVTSTIELTDGTAFDAAAINGNINVNDFFIGDADDSGEIGLSDVLIIKQYLADEEYAKNNIVLDAADVDDDGDVDDDDVILLSKYCVGWNVQLG